MEHAFHALILPLSMGILVSAHLDPTSMVMAYVSVTMGTRGYLAEHAFRALILPPSMNTMVANALIRTA